MGISLTSASRGQLPHTLSHLPAVVLMRSSAVVDIGLSWSAPSHTLSSTSCGAHALICCRGHRPLVVCSLPPRSLSSTSCGAHALTCCRGHRPLEVSSLPDSLIYQLWCSCAHLLSWASSSRGQLPPRLSHLPAVVLMCSSAVVDILLSWSLPPTHSLIY